MESFTKITEELYEKEETDIEKYLCHKVKVMHTGRQMDFSCNIDEALFDCESPIEQLLSIEFEVMGLTNLVMYNPFIDVLAVEKQKKIKCGKNTYRVDFYIPVIYENQESIRFVVECDGHEFHQKTKEQVEKDNIRMRDLQKEGYEIIRFSGTEVWHKPRKCATEVLNIILSKCKYIK